MEDIFRAALERGVVTGEGRLRHFGTGESIPIEYRVAKHGVLEEDVAFLAKPYKPGELARHVRRVLDEQ